MGLAIAREIKKRFPAASLLIIEKEAREALHASGRNSGVLHAGFYYTADSLKAQWTAAGNRLMKEYCQERNIPVNYCGKLVVATDVKEIDQLAELERRGKKNGANVMLVDEARAQAIEPNVRTLRQALYSPDTASVDPVQVCAALKKDLEDQGVEFLFGTKYLGIEKRVASVMGNIIHTNGGDLAAVKVFNCAGLYADRIAHDFGFGRGYTIIPFKGLYLKYTKNKTDVRTNIYPVPNLKNPFLGVHFTKLVNGEIKIGPTAIPAFWRENYAGFSNFHADEFFEICNQEARLFLFNAFGFRELAIEEIKKYNRAYMIQLAQRLVQHIDPRGFTETTAPGIRAQLLDIQRQQLVQDFIVEGDGHSIHVLNAVSPAFTCAFPFSTYVVDKYIVNK